MDSDDEENEDSCFPCGLYKEEPVVKAFEDALIEMLTASDEINEATKRGKYNSNAPYHLIVLTTQTMHLLTSIRHSIDAGFLFSAAVVMRPIYERLGLIAFLSCNPARVDEWIDGWPNQTQPSFQDLMSALKECQSLSLGYPRFRVLNSLIHGNSETAIFGAGRMQGDLCWFSPQAMKDRPDLANLIALDAAACVLQLLNLQICHFGTVLANGNLDGRLARCWQQLDPLIEKYGT